jgi:hypothetical protein
MKTQNKTSETYATQQEALEKLRESTYRGGIYIHHSASSEGDFLIKTLISVIGVRKTSGGWKIFEISYD